MFDYLATLFLTKRQTPPYFFYTEVKVSYGKDLMICKSFHTIFHMFYTLLNILLGLYLYQHRAAGISKVSNKSQQLVNWCYDSQKKQNGQ